MSYIIGIVGGSGSGKTTFINKLRESFREAELCIISQDNYYKPVEEQVTDSNNVVNFDLPSAIDLMTLARDVVTIKSGKEVVLNEYTFNNVNVVPKKISLKPAPLILVEGVFVFHDVQLQQLCDMKIYFHTHENLKLIRRIKRDQKERNYTIDDVMYRYEHHVIPCFKNYVEPYIDQCDIIINNHKNFLNALEILTGFMKYKLNK